MRWIFFIILMISFKSFAGNVDDFDYSNFAKIPILDEGRVKPIDSFARVNLVNFSGKDYVGNMSAIKWLAELLFSRDKAYDRKVFYIANADVVSSIGLVNRKKHYYSFNEISEAIEGHLEMVSALYQKDIQGLSLAQEQLLTLYKKTLLYYAISRSSSVLVESFLFSDELAQELKLVSRKSYSYFEIMQKKGIIFDLVKPVFNKVQQGKNLDEREEELVQLVSKLQFISEDKKFRILRVIPSIWQDSKNIWSSPWEIMENGLGSPISSYYMGLWNGLAEAYKDGNKQEWSDISQKYQKESLSQEKISSEVLYHKLTLFKKSMLLYSVALLVFVVGFFVSKKNLFYRVGFSLFVLGAVCHFGGILMRIYIMGRPPVSTLYESIIFVNFVVIFFTILMEWRRKTGEGIVIGSLLGIILHFIGIKYSVSGDSMGMLVAVLNTNFWLATHVVTITIGYGCCFIAGMEAHHYLIRKFMSSDKKKLDNILHNMIGMGLIALFFSLLGTILGGIWADQSWGRFWGWDPKENGAMLIVLWLIWLLHGRLAKMLSDISFASLMVCTNIIVALAWFGVNLLNVGLHSYGFTDNIAMNLMLFCMGEILFIILMLTLINMKISSIATTHNDSTA